MSLREKAMELNGSSLHFMEGREKAELPTMSPVTIDDYGFLTGDNGDYVVISLKEFPKNFYFGGSVLTDRMAKIDELIKNDKDDLEDFQTNGLPVLFNKYRSKNKRDYMTCEFYPAE